MCVRHKPHSTFALTSQVFQAKESLSSWRRALLKKAEKVIEKYFADEVHFPTALDIARQVQFLLGDGSVIPWLFKDGPNVTKIEDLVRMSINVPNFPLTNVYQSSTGYYRSSFIVETLAVHFERSLTRPTAAQVHPAGALAITLLAVMSSAFNPLTES